MESLKKYILKASKWSKGILFDDIKIAELNTQDTKDYQELKSGKYATWRKKVKSQFDKDKSWENLQEQIKPKESKPIIIHLIEYWQSAAAILLLGVLIYGGYLVYQDIQSLKQVDIVPGTSLAYL